LTSNITPPNREELRNKLREAGEVNIIVEGRRTGKKFSTPVWFVLDGSKVVLVPMKGSDNDWFKDLEKSPHVELSAGGRTFPFEVTIIRDSNLVEKVLDKFRAKYRSMWSESYYSKRDVCVEVSL